ncbi:MAG TPA: hypothetical protein VLT16_04155, partial [Candidatus Limnocylindrales bacterium]|nr:hypothetical protein [Candidatus Limnocylindrales bacterium]
TFLQGQTGTYSISVSNTGTGPSSGAVTVTDPLPAGLTATAISGTGWTCSAVTASPLTCTRSDILAAGSSYPAISLQVNIAAGAPATVTNSATVSGGGDSNTANNTAADPTSIGTVDLGVSLVAGQGLSVGDTGDVFVYRVSNLGNASSSGAVTLTYAVSTGLTVTGISGTGWNCTIATLTCTRSDAAPNGGAFPDITVQVSVAVNAPASVTSTLTVSGGGDSVPANNTLSQNSTVNPAVTIGSTTGSVTVTAGQPALIPLTVNLAQAAGSATLSCTGLPSAASCSFSPTTVTSGSPAVTLTISTTARAAAALEDFRIPGGSLPNAFLPALSLLGLCAALFAFGRHGRIRLPKLKPAFGLGIAGLVILGALAGCGGSPTPVAQPATGTPAGTYSVTVTGTSAIGAASTVISLTVK